MSKTFYTTGTGSNQTLTNIQNEKIPLYDSEQDAESDLANLAEGQIVGTKESKFDVDDMKQYIRNQNVLSDWESITLSTDSNNPTVMEYDGFLSVYSTLNQQNQSLLTVIVNGVTINESASSNFSHATLGVIPIKMSDSVVVNGSSIVAKVAYYKLRDYTDR